MKFNITDNCTLFANNYDYGCVESIRKLALENPYSSIRVMPDYHLGAGCVIGTTMKIVDKVNPNHVGVDIGCGVTGVRFKFDNNGFEADLDRFIKENIPSGFSRRTRGEAQIPELLRVKIYAICKKIGLDFDDVMNSCGSLGGGNHYIELGTCSSNFYWLTIHSGSRNFGKSVCVYHAKKADADGYLTGLDMIEYLEDMHICVEYAMFNRKQMIDTIMKWFFDIPKYQIINTIHNYIDEDNVLRKGAISAKDQELLLIPMNMRDGVIFGRGLGNEDWNNSAPHGAGRLLSRGKAKAELSILDFDKAMEGIYTSCVSTSTLDESPMAYKPMNDIVECIKDTVKIMEIIKPIYNFKGM